MKSVQTAHPTADQLAAFDQGRLSPEDWSQVEAHVAACPACCRALEGVGDDALGVLMRASAGKGATAGPADTGDWTSASTDSPDMGDTKVADPPPELADHSRYRLLGLLGTGGMGAVFKAEHRLMNRVVALKVINRALVARPEMVQRFRREVQAAARLNHPNIVTAHDAEQAGDAHFLVMEFVEGTSLDRWVRAKGPLPIEEACDYVRQAALGLDHASRHGMVHRDIKPQNLMRTPQGCVKVLDFGLAACFGATGPTEGLTPTGSVLGTPDYIAPEQALDPQLADARSDIYSLGCTFYHLLSGRPPFPTGTALQKLIAHRETPPVPVSQLRPDIPPGLSQLVDRMLSKDPSGRPQSPVEVAAALVPFVRALPVLEELPSAAEKSSAAAAAPSPPPLPVAPPRGPGSAGWMLALFGIAAALGVAVGLVAFFSLTGGNNDRSGVADTEKRDRKDSNEMQEPSSPDPSGPTGVPIPAPRLVDSKLEVELPEPFEQVRTGGGGRYLIFHLKKAKKLAIFDISEARIVKEIEVPDDVLYAAGLDSLMVVLPGQKLLYRWSFKTFDRSKGVPVPGNQSVRLAVMGASSQGPLLLWSGGNVALWDVQKLEPMTVKGKVGSGDPTYGFQLRVSADGRNFVAWHGGISGQQYGLMHLEGNRTSHKRSPDGHTFNEHWALPGPDGRLIFRHGAGVYDSDFKPLATGDFPKDSVLLPTEDPRFFLAVWPESRDADHVAVCTAADRRPVLTLDGIDRTTSSGLYTRWGLVGSEARHHYIPSAKVLITLPETNDRVVLRPLDLDDELKRSEKPYLFVASVPPARVESGSLFAYKLDVRSKAGGLRFQLDKGPNGMKVSDDGVLTWKVPSRQDGKTFPVVVTVRDADGKEIFHTFEIPVVARGTRAR